MKQCFLKSILLTVLSLSLFIFNPVHAEHSAKNSQYSLHKATPTIPNLPESKLKNKMPAAHHRQKLKHTAKKRIPKKRLHLRKAKVVHSRNTLPAYSSRFKSPLYLQQQEITPLAATLVSNDTHLPLSQPSVDLIYKTVGSLNYSSYKLGANRFDLNQGVFIVDCSSYVDRILRETYPFAYRHFTESMQTDRPTTEHYYRFFKQLNEDHQNPYWGKVDTVPELKAGDVLVFRYKNAKGHRSGSGHVMLVMEKPKKASDGYLVKVADAASSGHSNDTRSRGNSGIGIGTMQLKAHPETGKPFAFSWKIGAWWKRNVDIIMGRPALPHERRLEVA